MPADAVIVRPGPVAAPLDYTVPVGTEIIPRVISATLDGTSAGGPFLAVLEVIAPSGVVTARCCRTVSIAAGASAAVSWFPFVGDTGETESTSAAAGTIESLVSPSATLQIAEPQGPNTQIDLPVSGVTPGTYGDGTHVSEITVDAEGRVTAAANAAITGGSSTVGFEFDYAQITSLVTVTSTTEAAPTAVVTGGAVPYDGATVILVEFFAPAANISVGANPELFVNLWDGATNLGRLMQIQAAAPSTVVRKAVYLVARLTPSAGSHTYACQAWKNAAATVAQIGSDVSELPTFQRITRVA